MQKRTRTEDIRRLGSRKMIELALKYLKSISYNNNLLNKWIIITVLATSIILLLLQFAPI